MNLKKMYRLILILFFLSLISCGTDIEEQNFFYNTVTAYNNKYCNDSKKQWTWVYNLDDVSSIYSCKPKVNESVTDFYIIENSTKNIAENFSIDLKLTPWTLTYDNRVVGIGESSNDKNHKHLIALNIETKKMETLLELPYNTYWFSEHPISENGILVFTANINNVIIFDLNSKIILNEPFKSQSRPIVSKNGEKIVYIKQQEVFLYDVEKETSTSVYSSADKTYRDAFKAFFDNKNNVIVRELKNSGFMPLENIQDILITEDKVIKKGTYDFNKGYKYY